MNTRIERIKSFERFNNDAKELFEGYAKSDKDNSRLNGLFSLCICPGGRDGGLNEKQVEVFYGRRPIGSTTITGSNFQTKTKLEIAYGATLEYFRTDDGRVICYLYPACSENQRPIESAIIFDYIKEPSDLTRISARHWKFFIAYMESTCIDGNPRLIHKIRIFYLRNFKKSIVKDTVQQSLFWGLTKEISKYVLTIGLSGFLILAFTIIKGNIDSAKDQSKNEKLQSVLHEISISNSQLSKDIRDSNKILAHSLDQLENINPILKSPQYKESIDAHPINKQSTGKIRASNKSFKADIVPVRP